MSHKTAQKAPGRGLRRPPSSSADPALVQRFVDDADARNISNVQNVQDVRDVQDVQPAATSSEVTRTDGRTLRRTTVYLKPELHERLKTAARLSGSDGSAIINELLDAHLGGMIRQAIEGLSG